MLLCDLLLFFFFKQKTAYEMRISDWSSDVCSSDLPGLRFEQRPDRGRDAERGQFVACNPAKGFIVSHEGARRDFAPAQRQQRQPVAGESMEIGRASCRERVCQYV